jgi:copper chaperone NosL
VIISKTAVAVAVMVLTVAATTYAFGFLAPKDLVQYPECLHCGMSRKDCAHTRMTVTYTDGTSRAECGLHCLLADLVEQPGRQPQAILAADYNDRKLADAQKSWWVRYENEGGCRGSKIMLAFRTERGADDFVGSFGGIKLNFDEALRLTYLDVEAERRAFYLARQ